jgi:NADH dehydrogenase FAD-containing subunit
MELKDKTKLPHVVIVGGGFGDMEVARELADKPVDVTNLHLRFKHL